MSENREKEIRFDPEDEIIIRLFLNLPYGDKREAGGYIRCLDGCNLERWQQETT